MAAKPVEIKGVAAGIAPPFVEPPVIGAMNPRTMEAPGHQKAREVNLRHHIGDGKLVDTPISLSKAAAGFCADFLVGTDTVGTDHHFLTWCDAGPVGHSTRTPILATFPLREVILSAPAAANRCGAGCT